MLPLQLLVVIALGLPPLEVDQARSQIITEVQQRFDHQHGALQEKQKFPVPALSDALLLFSYRHGSLRHLQMATLTLDQMHSGALYDHIGGGFFNHTRDPAWQVPRFLRNTTVTAALMSVYLRAYRQTGVERYRQTAAGCRDFLIDEALQSEGFFSPGIGGSGDPWTQYYTWTREELLDILSPVQVELAALHWGITAEGPPRGPLSGRSVPRIARPLTAAAAALGITLPEAEHLLDEARVKLAAARRARRSLSSAGALNAEANSAAILALLDAAELLQDDVARRAALRAVNLLSQRSLTPRDGVMGVVPLDGSDPSYFGSLRTNAVVGMALLRAYFCTYDTRFLDSAAAVGSFCRARLWDPELHAFVDYTDESDVPRLGQAKVDINDAHLMSANSLMVLLLEDLSLATGKDSYHQWARDALVAGARQVPGRAHRAASYLIAADRWQRGRVLVAVVGRSAPLAAAARRWLSVAEIDALPPHAPHGAPVPCAVVVAPSGAVTIETDGAALESALRAHR
jgi:uncharacterized protein YyaL (SSP411 family)